MFKFGFGEEESPQTEQPALQTEAPQIHDFSLLRQSAPRISYTSYPVSEDIMLPRRDFFDAKCQLMGEDNLTESDQLLLGTEDVRKTVYEGGLKVWEGTNDLLAVLSTSNYEGSVIELGCGAGIPACFQFYRALKSNKPGRFVLADYNTSVLRLITMPNIILAWLAATKELEPKGEINLTVDLIDECVADLNRRQISVQFISGGWSPAFVELANGPFDLVLASETIYSLDSIVAFTDVLAAVKGQTALVAAKKVYFGVGGGIIEFERQLTSRNLGFKTVYETGNVGRVVLSVE